MTAPSRARAAPTPSAPAHTSGLHLLGDLRGCQAPQLMNDAAQLEALCTACVAANGLTAVGSLFHPFDEGGGVTGVVVLAESHLAIHTWPEENYVTLDVYVCNYSCDNRAKAERLFAALCAAFHPQNPQVQRVERGSQG